MDVLGIVLAILIGLAVLAGLAFFGFVAWFIFRTFRQVFKSQKEFDKNWDQKAWDRHRR